MNSHVDQAYLPPALELLEPESPERPEFKLDREQAERLIARTWEIDPRHRDAWRIDAFGPGLATSVERLSQIVFLPQHGVVSGPALEVLVLPVVPDSPAHPVMVGVLDGQGPIVCRGIEDLVEVLANPFGRGPEHVLDALEALLLVASGLVPEVERLQSPPPPRSALGYERGHRRRP